MKYILAIIEIYFNIIKIYNMPGMKRSRKRKSRKSRRRRGGFLRPSDVKKCKASGVSWDKCAGHLAAAAKEAVKAKVAMPAAATTALAPTAPTP